MPAVILFFAVSCPDPSDNSDEERPTHFPNVLKITGEQVYLPNYDTTKISQALIKFTDNNPLYVTIGLKNQGFFEAGSGNIKNGKIDFTVSAPEAKYLLNSDDFLDIYFDGWEKISMNTDANCNVITLITSFSDEEQNEPHEVLIREGFSGTRTSLTGEYIYYAYADRNCTITAEETVVSDLFYTYKAFEINLKKGWNTICKRETYTTSGNSSFYVEIKNPDIQWIMLEY